MTDTDLTRRRLIEASAAGIIVGSTSTAIAAEPAGDAARQNAAPAEGAAAATNVTLRINGHDVRLTLDPRTSLLDALREHAGLMGTKKGCDFGSCGACTVHLDGERIVSCLALAVRCQGHAITTIEGLANGDTLHPVQAAFVHHDGYQCGYCTPGQIMSAVALLHEGHAGSDDEIREWMSGNICRCGAYPNIVAAVKDAAQTVARG
jgi:xanthine dehydrogenase YagT iron-sulfur-binding subunit